MDLAYITALTPGEFEHFVADILRDDGYSDVVVQGGRADHGVDITCRDADGRPVVVQCKRYTGAPISPATIREFIGAISLAKADYGIFACTPGFTSQARAHAAAYDITLLDGISLAKAAEAIIKRERRAQGLAEQEAFRESAARAHKLSARETELRSQSRRMIESQPHITPFPGMTLDEWKQKYREARTRRSGHSTVVGSRRAEQAPQADAEGDAERARADADRERERSRAQRESADRSISGWAYRGAKLKPKLAIRIAMALEHELAEGEHVLAVCRCGNLRQMLDVFVVTSRRLLGYYTSDLPRVEIALSTVTSLSMTTRLGTDILIVERQGGPTCKFVLADSKDAAPLRTLIANLPLSANNEPSANAPARSDASVALEAEQVPQGDQGPQQHRPPRPAAWLGAAITLVIFPTLPLYGMWVFKWNKRRSWIAFGILTVVYVAVGLTTNYDFLRE